MHIVYIVIFFMGTIINMIGAVMMLVAAFRQSVWWGLGVLFVPFVSLIFIIVHWDEARRAFLWQLSGFGIAMLAWLGLFSGLSSKAKTGGFQFKPAEVQKAAPVKAVTRSLQQTIDKVKKDEERKPVVIGSRSEYVGMSLDTVQDKLGEPKGILKVDGKTVYFYPEVELTSDDGATVSSVSLR